MNQKDRGIIRRLAARVAEIADTSEMERRRDLWRKHHALIKQRPLLLVCPEGAWRELLPAACLECEGEEARKMEFELRSRLYAYENFYDDRPVEKSWKVLKTVRNLIVQWCQPVSWGLEIKHVESSAETGAWGFDPVLKDRADLQKLKIPEIEYDEKTSLSNLEKAQDLLGDLMDVRLTGVTHISFHPIARYSALRGLEQMMYDVYEEPEMLHEAMRFFEEGYKAVIRQCAEQNLLSLNNDDTWHGSGGLGYSQELPKDGFKADCIRTCDMWASAEAQETAQISPEMYREFVLPYERRLLEPFGLNGYGCCEDVTKRLDDIFTLPNLRRISVSPWANVEACAKKLKDKYIFSWKPHPAFVSVQYNETEIQKYLEKTLELTRDNVLEIILKDTHTCEHKPERFTRWTEIAREMVGR